MAGKGLTASVIAGSDVVFDFACDVCAEFDKNFEAFGYCQDCGDYLCRECYTSHGINRTSRNHRLQDRKSMPRKKPAAPTRPATAGFDMCAKHPNRMAEYYCKDDKLLGCSVCMTTKHRSCQAVDHIPDISGQLLDSSDFKKFCNTLARLQTQARDVIKASKTNVSRAEKCFSDIPKALKVLRKKMNDAFDKLEENMSKSTETIKSADIQKLTNISDQGQTVLDEVEKMSADMQTLKKKNQLDQLFIKMVKHKDTLQTFETILHEADADNTVTTYTFEPGPRIREILADPASIGELCLQGSPAAISPQAATRPAQQKQAGKPRTTKANATATAPTHVLTSGDIKAVSAGNICVKTNGDTERYCRITGSALLPGNKLILTDYSNCKVKLVNLQTSAVTAELKTSSGPWDITSISGDTVAVTVPGSRKIVIVKVRDQLRLDRELPVDGECRAVLHSNGNLIVSYIRPIKIEIMSLDGKAIRKIAHSESLQYPWYMALSENNKALYVSDFDGHCVTRLSLDEAVEATYKDKELRGPRGVVGVGQQGRLLVCGRDSHNIHLLEPGLTQGKLLLQGIDYPQSLSYCHSTGRLYVGMEYSDNIKVYQMS